MNSYNVGNGLTESLHFKNSIFFPGKNSIEEYLSGSLNGAL
jgi:hypothetical protein